MKLAKALLTAKVELRYAIPTSASGEHTRFRHSRANYLPSQARENEFEPGVPPLERV